MRTRANASRTNVVFIAPSRCERVSSLDGQEARAAAWATGGAVERGVFVNTRLLASLFPTDIRKGNFELAVID